jgi:osmoprotectant transport system substrate-binding protein
MSSAVLAHFPELRAAVSALAGAITDDEMRRLNALVDGQRRDVKEVVKEFRAANRL